MVYIQAKSDIKDSEGKIIKRGIDLFQHENSVCDSAFSINLMGDYNLNFEIIRWFSIIHDLGKANPLFLSNMLKITDARDIICRHEISSILFIDVVPSEIRDTVAMLVLSHHKSISENDERSIRAIVNIDGFEENWFSKRNKTLWRHIEGIDVWGKNIITFLKEHYNIDASIPSEERIKEILFKYATMRCEKNYSEYRGLCMMADHIASAYEDDTERILILQNLFKKPDLSFYYTENEKYPLSLIKSDNTKKHTFCIAPCGSGKTNFILKRCQGRVFYMLPFQASINSMTKRIQHDIGDNYIVGVKHASYKALDFIDDTTKNLSNLFGLPVKVMTPFQVMAINFRLKGYETIIMDMKGQDVIMDEIHTYSGKNMTCIIELIRVLKHIGCRIHICTATMPSVLKNEIMEILGDEETQMVQLTPKQISSFNRHIIRTKEDFQIEDAIKRYENGEKVLIVHNQIKKAIETYTSIKNQNKNIKLLLLHSCFERGHRAILEKKLMEDFNRKNEPCIVVSTQVVEVSIDINFDVLYTDCADIMSLIQRFGRINRQRQNIGIYKDVIIFKPNMQDCLPYDSEVCKKTFIELQKMDGKVLDENDIQTIIDNVHPSLNNPSFNLSSPFKDGEWKTEMYCHTVNENISSNLEFDGYTLVCEKHVCEYQMNNDISYEIPVSSSKRKIIETLKEIPSKTGKQVFIVQDTMYNDELGLII